MARRRRNKNKELFYAELRVAGRIPVLKKEKIADKIIASLKWSCENRGLRIYEYSLLPDRVVMLAGTAWGNIHEVLDSFKNFTSKGIMMIFRESSDSAETAQMISKLQRYGAAGKTGIHIWESEPLIRSVFRQNQVDQCALNIHQKAVKAGLVSRPEDYPNSSANPRHPLEGWIVEATDPWS